MSRRRAKLSTKSRRVHVSMQLGGGGGHLPRVVGMERAEQISVCHDLKGYDMD